MFRLTNWTRRLSIGSGVDSGFEQYYGNIVRQQRDGAPSAAEARQDYEHVRRVISRAALY